MSLEKSNKTPNKSFQPTAKAATEFKCYASQWGNYEP